jgi:hypothetical protein
MMQFLLKIFVIVIFPCLRVEAIPISCGDTFLTSQGCSCEVSSNGQNAIQTMTCNSYLTNTTQNPLPPISTSKPPIKVQISDTYTMFPSVPVSYLLLDTIDLSHNRIKAIGNLTNLANLLLFDLSFNLLSELPKSMSLCLLKKCETLDLSYNLLETVYFESFVCETNTSSLDLSTNYVFSNLLKLSLAGNLIKVNIYYKLWTFGINQSLILFWKHFQKNLIGNFKWNQSFFRVKVFHNFIH